MVRFYHFEQGHFVLYLSRMYRVGLNIFGSCSSVAAEIAAGIPMLEKST